MIESDLVTFISSDEILKELVSNRIYPLVRPQKSVLPAITFQRVATERGYNLESEENFSVVRIQFNIFSKTYKEVKIIVERLIEILNGFKGKIGSTIVQGIFLELEVDDYDEEANIPWHILDFQIVCQE